MQLAPDRTLSVAAAVIAALLVPCLPVNAQQSLTGRFETRGSIVVVFDSAGLATFSGPRGVMIVSQYQTSGSHLTLRDESGPAACPGQSGQYDFTLRGDSLFFGLISDSCDGRRAAFGAPWLRTPSALVLRSVTVFDGTGAPPRSGQTLVLQNGVIRSVTTDGAAVIPPFADVRDLSGAWVMPGLIDAHVHIATNPSTTDTRDRVERRLANALLGGVVAVRDMAGDARSLAAIARDALTGDIESPLVIYTALFAGPDFFTDPRVRASSAGVAVGSAPWARAITDTTDLRQAIAEARGTGARGIKLYGSLDSATVDRIAREARNQQIRVWAHATLFPARPLQIVAAGVDAISHSALLAWQVVDSLPGVALRQQYDASLDASHPAISAVLERMRELDVILEPTLYVFRDDVQLPDTSLSRRRTRLAVEFARAAHYAGVRIAAGTDGIGGEGPGTLPNIHEELALLVEEAGMSPTDALQSATRINAELLGIAATHGTIAEGKAADLLVLNADPTTDIRNTRNIRLVIRVGRPVPHPPDP